MTKVSDGDLTIDELAHRSGTRTSTIRMYQSRGLLPPPQIRGRSGYYGTAHLTRLRTIARLQERGFSLAAVKDLLDGLARGASLAAVLDAEHELSAGAEPAELTQADFAALFPDGQVDPAVVHRAVALGLVQVDPERGTVRTSSRAFVEIGRELAAHRVPPGTALDEYEHLAADARRIADRFVALFEQYVLGPDQPTPEQLDALGPTIRRFRGLAAAAVHELVAGALDTAATDAIARRLGEPAS